MTRIKINGFTIEGDVADLRAIIGLNGVSHEVAEVEVPVAEPVAEPVVIPPMIRVRKKRSHRKHPVVFQNLENVQFWVELFKENGFNTPHVSTLVLEGFCNVHNTTLRYAKIDGSVAGCILCVRGRDKSKTEMMVQE